LGKIRHWRVSLEDKARGRFRFMEFKLRATGGK
jgi:hypothetical protein